ncbi:GntR family transcriptional regulator [Variovorax sp. KK3]|uniref:GntR family transcriptional regulator n=1 Tax=Variovorax sp. KK3 TaxID=1855728 RepID=UPI00097C527E|nr:GntR family transcriptional regulator [Variovorax sp. KK3]
MSIPLSRHQGELLHRQLFLALREQIRRGVYPPDSTIPPEDQLCNLFGVSRITVRRAVSDLVDAGLLEKRLGKGTFVLAQAGRASKRTSLNFVESLLQRSRQTKVKVLEFAPRVPPSDISGLLALDGRTEALFISRVRSVRTVPLMVIEAWLTARHAVHVTPERLRRQGLSETLIAHGVNYARVSQTITAVSADPQIASILDVDVGSPLLRLVRVIEEGPNAPVMHLAAYMTSERTSIVAEFKGTVLESREGGRLMHHVPTTP